MPENRLLAFEWPAQIRVGDSDLLRLTLLVDSQGNITPSAVFQEHEIQAQPLIVENLYDTHQIRAEARLDMAGLQVEPPGTTIQRLFPGEPVTFSWSVSPPTQGTYRGNVWLFLRYIPFEEGEPDTEKLIYSQPVEIQTVNLLGLGGRPARILGAIGSAIGSLLGLDDLISWLRRARRRASRR